MKWEKKENNLHYLDVKSLFGFRYSEMIKKDKYIYPSHVRSVNNSNLSLHFMTLTHFNQQHQNVEGMAKYVEYIKREDVTKRNLCIDFFCH